jgi:hypothetical protein
VRSCEPFQGHSAVAIDPKRQVVVLDVSAFALPASVCKHRIRILGHSVVPRWSGRHDQASEALWSGAEFGCDS